MDVETGEVVGINAAIRAHMEGTSFAIPVNRVRAIMNDLAEGRDINHGYLGISLATCTPDWARQNNANLKDTKAHIPEVYGAIVNNVFPRTPAEEGGLQSNDVVLTIGGKRIQSSDDARRLIDGAPVGEVRQLVVYLKLFVFRGRLKFEYVLVLIDRWGPLDDVVSFFLGSDNYSVEGQEASRLDRETCGSRDEASRYSTRAPTTAASRTAAIPRTWALQIHDTIMIDVLFPFLPVSSSRQSIGGRSLRCQSFVATPQFVQIVSWSTPEGHCAQRSNKTS